MVPRLGSLAAGALPVSVQITLLDSFNPSETGGLLTLNATTVPHGTLLFVIG
ncbi:MAG: hypothetical protein Q7W56_08585 [Candidatus Latescibacteria bacterium]|nr:hypothetical protein [Candidatus Latescibacterota bacterium]